MKSAVLVTKQLFSLSYFGSTAVSPFILRVINVEDLHLAPMTTEELNLCVSCNSVASLLEYFSLV